jgi:Fe-S-cluster containining protein
MQDLHEKVFEHTECLACANCCKTASPILTLKDIERISKHLKMKEIAFMEKYLFKDVDDFWAFTETPCPFLAPDNYCLIYDYRPKACSEYPHTNRRKFIQITDLTLKNAEICPAVFEIVEELKKVKF